MQPDPEYERYIISEGEWTIIIIGIVFQCINLCGLGYVLYHRNYPPLKIKQISVVTCNLLSPFFLISFPFLSFFLSFLFLY